MYRKVSLLTYIQACSPHDEHLSSGSKTSKTLFGTVNFTVFIKTYTCNKFRNLIRTSKFKFSFRGLNLYSTDKEPRKTKDHLFNISQSIMSVSFHYDFHISVTCN